MEHDKCDLFVKKNVVMHSKIIYNLHDGNNRAKDCPI